MDLLQTCAVGFHQLLTYQYHIVAGRKGRTIDFTISFDPSDFHHLAGLHKLTDNVRFLTGKRANIMQEILSGKLTLSHAQRSVFFKQMEPRLKPLAHLEEFLDSNEIVFRYNPRHMLFQRFRRTTCCKTVSRVHRYTYFWHGVWARTRRYAVPFSQNRKRTMPRVSRVIPC